MSPAPTAMARHVGPPGTSVSVTVPASPVYAAVPRFTAAMLASTAGFSYDDVERLRDGLDGVWELLSGAVPRDTSVTFEFELETGALRVAGYDGDGGPAGREPLARRRIELAVTWWATAEGVAAGG